MEEQAAQQKKRFAELTKQIKDNGCTSDGADALYGPGVHSTDFFKRLRRLHINAFSRRIFASRQAGGWDVGWYQPQYIGRDEGNVNYRLKGLYVPLDPDGCDYYMNRRLEYRYPGIASYSMWKSKPAESSSPSRWTHRSKLGTHVAPRQLSGSASSSAVPIPSQKAGKKIDREVWDPVNNAVLGEPSDSDDLD